MHGSVAPSSCDLCLRAPPRSAPSARTTSCEAWSMRDLSSPASSRATGWVSTGGEQAAEGTPKFTSSAPQLPLTITGVFSSPPILMAGIGNDTKRWPRSWRLCTWKLFVRR